MKENNNLSLSDLSDSTILRENESLLSLLLKDHTTGKNIKWGTDSYINHGYSFQENQEIKINLITEWYDGFIRPRVEKDLDDQLSRQRNRAEVFTPSWVIKLQVEAALEDIEELPLIDFIQTKWLEITCGEAPYMANRYDMETGDIIPLKERSGFIDIKFKKLNREIGSEEEWLKLAVEIYKASYGYEYQGDSLLLARENLILTFIDNYFYMFGAFPKEKILLELTKIISLNVFQMDGLTYEVPFSVGSHEEMGIQLNLFEDVVVEENITPKLAKIKLWQKNKFIEVKKMSERDDTEMKFDVVIGNPPYQAKTIGDNKTFSPPIYNVFLEEAYKLADKVIMIHPARFLFNAGSTPKAWNEKMLSDPHLKVLHYTENSREIFDNTDIKGGIAVTLRDKNKEFGEIGVFIKIPELDSIYRKISKHESTSMSDLIHTKDSYRFTQDLHDDFPNAKEKLSKSHEFDVASNIFEKLPEVFSEESKDKINYVAIHGRKNNERTSMYIKRNYIKEHPNLNYYKVLMPGANGSGEFGEAITMPFVAGPGEGHTATYISVGSFQTENEANNLLKYVKTKFARAILGILKVTPRNGRTSWKLVPTQYFSRNLDIDWTMSINEIDQQLYNKYDLSQEEIDFIETNVKEME
ncbi:Eco57I restriction-modification methylase domain-containing protein [Aerococcus urinaeequi]|uniref:Eco57I restriction-modification methylase domain-containing protein n=1 Tax=Aerococcus urinaeequi TaxID=51665 RepID=UPI003AB03CFA